MPKIQQIAPAPSIDDQHPKRERDIEDLPAPFRAAIHAGIYGTSEGIILDGFSKASPGRRLAILREIRGWSQAQLAKRAKVRQADVSIGEKELNNLSLGKVISLVKALGVSMEFLLRPADIQRSER